MNDADEPIHPLAAAVTDSSPDSAADDGLLIHWLSTHNAPCPLCGYNLRALQTPRCPECAQRLQLHVALADLSLGPWISLLVALLLPAGFGVVVIAVFLIAFAHEGVGMFIGFGIPAGPCFLMTYLVSSVPLSIATLLYRRRILRWSVQSQRTCARLAWAALGVTALILLFETMS